MRYPLRGRQEDQVSTDVLSSADGTCLHLCWHNRRYRHRRENSQLQQRLLLLLNCPPARSQQLLCYTASISRRCHPRPRLTMLHRSTTGHCPRSSYCSRLLAHPDDPASPQKQRSVRIKLFMARSGPAGEPSLLPFTSAIIENDPCGRISRRSYSTFPVSDPHQLSPTSRKSPSAMVRS